MYVPDLFVVMSGCLDDADDCTNLVGVYTLPALAETAVNRHFSGLQYGQPLLWGHDRNLPCTPDRYYFYEIRLVKVNADA